MLENLAIRKIAFSGLKTGLTKREKRLDSKLENFSKLSFSEQIVTSIEFFIRFEWLYTQFIGVQRGKLRPAIRRI